MKFWSKYRLKNYLFALLAAAVIMELGVTARQMIVNARQREMNYILHLLSENILVQLKSNLNEADSLAQMAGDVDDNGIRWFERAAAPLLEREEVLYICLFQGDTLVSAFPKASYGRQEGLGLKDFSYIYTMAKVTKDFVVEGPVTMDFGEDSRKVFLFLRPIIKDGAYLGEVVVALDSSYVMERIGLHYLAERGYDYELWRVEPQNGGKEIIAVSGDNVDFSYAAKTTFYLPTEWHLSAQPAGGWVGIYTHTALVILCFALVALSLALSFYRGRCRSQRIRLERMALTDIRTGLYNQAGFTSRLNEWLSKGGSVILFYFVFEGYNQIAQLIGPREEEAFLSSIPKRLDAFIQNPYFAGRLESGNFAIAVREEMDEEEREDFARGLSLELILKTNLNGQRGFLSARYRYALCREEAGTAQEQLAALIRSYYERLKQESPARMLTEKCRQLMEGRSDVVFSEYTDLEMMELSKTFNQYRKQVEQLAYFDPMFNVGNRQKYFRDANMLISYDKKRVFHIYCVDICQFSQYNELFSAEVGDEILREALNRLSRLFGTYLYRINGDVFLGISLSGENENRVAERIQDLLTKPVMVGNAPLALKARVVVCGYPVHGGGPDVLLEHIQSAVRYAKENNRKIVIYNESLDERFRTEADILRRLKAGIREKTMEVWYQPLMDLSMGRFTVVEALTRLSNGQGGYFGAGQVIALAERSGMADELGDYVLEQACRFMRGWGEKLGLNHMGINLSVQQLLLDNSAERLLRMIEGTGVNTDKITLEITESILIQSIEQASSALDTLRAAGIRIALDDFGVGYSSLNYLSNLPVDVIKIDRSLTKEIVTSYKQNALLHAIVEMAKINSLDIVVEGCETEQEQKMIEASGVQYIQGFYYARPMPEDKLIHFLEKQTRQYH